MNNIAKALNLPAEYGYIVFRKTSDASVHCILRYTPRAQEYMIGESVIRIDGVSVGGQVAVPAGKDAVHHLAQHPILSHNKRGPRRKDFTGLTHEFFKADTEEGRGVSNLADSMRRQKRRANGDSFA